MELLVVFCIAGRRQPMTFGGSGALNDYHGRGHRVFGMRSHVTIHVCMALPLRSVATITGYMAQIPGVSDRHLLWVSFHFFLKARILLPN
jgi:hypothetical protein